MSFLRVVLYVSFGLILVGLIILIFAHRQKISDAHRWNTARTVMLPQGRKIVGATWKDNNLWVLTRPAAEIEISDEVMYLDEHSGWGVLSGHIVLQETKIAEERR
jgi:hypothetical protein